MKILNYFYFLLLLLPLSAKSQYQSFIGKNEKYIEDKMKSEGGIPKIRKNMWDFVHKGRFTKMYYTFPKDVFVKTNVYSKIFYLTSQDYCFESDINYASDKFLKYVILDLQNDKILEKRNDDTQTWVDLKKKYQISVIRAIGMGMPQGTTAFTVQSILINDINKN